MMRDTLDEPRDGSDTAIVAPDEATTGSTSEEAISSSSSSSFGRAQGVETVEEDSRASYSATTLKTQLRMSVQRLMMHRNKKSNQGTVDSKQVAILLQQGKDESARIRCEAILHERHLENAMEMVQLMCELLVTRTPLVTASKTCPTDLEEGMATLIYCSTRMEIPELATVSQQFGAKYGRAWAQSHVDNESGKVHPRVLEKLSIQPPPFELVLHTLQAIAKQYGVEWEPDMAALASGVVDHSDPQQLGSIARIPGAQEAASPSSSSSAAAVASPAVQPLPVAVPPSVSAAPQYPPAPVVSGVSPSGGFNSAAYPTAAASSVAPSLDLVGTHSPTAYPGTLNLVVPRGRDFVNLASRSEPHDLFVRLTAVQTGVAWRSASDPTGGANPLWSGNPRLPAGSTHHFPFSVQSPTQQVRVEVMQRTSQSGLGSLLGRSSDARLLGSATFYVDHLRASPQPQWYAVYRDNMQAGQVLMQTQYIPLNAAVLSRDDAEMQRAWIEREQRQRQELEAAAAAEEAAAQQQQTASSPSAPGGPGLAVVTYPDSTSGSSDGPGAPGSRRGSDSDSNGGGGGGGGGVTSDRNNSFGDRVRGLFREPEESPPHAYGRSLGDLANSTPATQDSTRVASARDVTLPDSSYRALASEPGAAITPSPLPPREQEGYRPPAPRVDAPPSQPAAASSTATTSTTDANEQELDLDFPAVPTHDAGRAIAVADATSSSSSSSSSGNTRRTGRGSGGPSSYGGGGSGGMGGTVYAPPRPQKVDEDAALEARFKALQ